MDDRSPHWIRHNKQERLPPRMVAIDTEAWSNYAKEVESQQWRLGCAIRWRTDLKSGDRQEGAVFYSPEELWSWVSSFCREGTRTVVWCHNLGYDARISQAFTILPKLGYRLEWCNLDRNVSSMTWRSDHGTLVFADTWTWIPMKLAAIAPLAGTVKYEMPENSNPDGQWETYCMRDTEIVYRVVSRLCNYITSNHLGNWQPTGAGMAMATWRHKFLHHKIFVHDDQDALQAERSAMYTGRAEAWKHGKLGIGTWTEVDLRNAYINIAASTPLPRKLHMSTNSLSMRQYGNLRDRFAVLGYCDVHIEHPVLPLRNNGHILWPVGNFSGWYWDTEIDAALRYGAEVRIRKSYVYIKDPILKDWAEWVLSIVQDKDDDTDPVVKTWVKHCGRALIGRISLRTPSWEIWGDNPEGMTGITYVTFPDTGITCRLMHVGPDTLIETRRTEGKDSLPQVTGYIMAKCRDMLWEGMNIAGLDNIAHVDTDSVLCNRAGLGAMRDHYGSRFADMWTVKGSYKRLEVWAPRTYRRDGARVTSGIPTRAQEDPDGIIRGEQWLSLSHDLEKHQGSVVTIRPAAWTIKKTDPRRCSSPGGGTATEAYSVGSSSMTSSSDVPDAGVGSYPTVLMESLAPGYSFPSPSVLVWPSSIFAISALLLVCAILMYAA